MFVNLLIVPVNIGKYDQINSYQQIIIKLTLNGRVRNAYQTKNIVALNTNFNTIDKNNSINYI